MTTQFIEPEVERSADPRLGVIARDATLSRRFDQWLVLGPLVLLMLVQLWTSVHQLSITSDEIDHLHAGYRYLQCNDFGWNPEHPPLVKMIAALPLLALPVVDPVPHACGLAENKELDFFYGHAFAAANRESVLMAARFAVSLFAILLLLTVWFFARKMFGLPVAIVAGVLIVFEPNVLAHGALVTTDVAAALGILLVCTRSIAMSRRQQRRDYSLWAWRPGLPCAQSIPQFCSRQ
jgi:dolichyl-phosphate-mannose--protein O-mannosyl transferase